MIKPRFHHCWTLAIVRLVGPLEKLESVYLQSQSTTAKLGVSIPVEFANLNRISVAVRRPAAKEAGVQSQSNTEQI